MTQCELCGRALAQRALTAVWYPHDTVCDRAGCRAAARDSVTAIMDSRREFRDLAIGIAKRHETQPFAYGWRDDAMARTDVVDDEDWWASNILKQMVNA